MHIVSSLSVRHIHISLFDNLKKFQTHPWILPAPRRIPVRRGALPTPSCQERIRTRRHERQQPHDFLRPPQIGPRTGRSHRHRPNRQGGQEKRKRGVFQGRNAQDQVSPAGNHPCQRAGGWSGLRVLLENGLGRPHPMRANNQKPPGQTPETRMTTSPDKPKQAPANRRGFSFTFTANPTPS